MNYNEYDGNGNKNRFNLSEIINDKTQRSRFLLFVYLVLFIVLVVAVRINLRNTKQDSNETNKNNVVDDNIPVENDTNKIDEMFSFIDLKNYDFIYEININNSNSLVEGKRNNNKYSFTLNSAGSILYFSGVSSYIKARESIDEEYKVVSFPYVLVNYFDTDIVKELIKESTEVSDKYEITTEKVGVVTNYDLNGIETVNTIELVKSNNRITQIHMDLSNAISSYLNQTVEAKFVLKYGNFGLVDDFEVE